jgi:putative endopeptidase
MMTRSRLLLAIGTAALFDRHAVHAQASRRPKPLAPLKVIDTSYMDRSVKACVDFFSFANGAWVKRDTIPLDYSSSGVARDMSDRNELVVRSVLDDVMKRRSSLAAQSTPRKLGTYYASCMDSASAEREGMTPIKPQLAAIDSVNSRTALLRQMARMQMNGAVAGFSYGPDVDPHDAGHYLGGFDAGGLGLPDRDYYTLTDPSSDSLRAFYVDHIVRVLTLAGEDAARARNEARRILALETELAKASLTRVARRDPSALDHPMTIEKFGQSTPNLDWPVYFREVGLASPLKKVNVTEPNFFKRLDALLAGVPLDDWKAYLRYHAIDESAAWLSTPFVNEHFRFSSKFTGAKVLLPRWKRCLRETDATIGEALGEAYIAKNFSPQAKARAKAVIDDIRAAFGQRVQKLDWMSAATKKQALDKLAKMREKIGYPDRWRDYSSLTVADGPFALNVQRASAFEWRRTVNRPGLPVDTAEWGITVPTVNAYYNPQKNEMVFPAGALVPQTFDAAVDDAANYGSLGGSWAGHELTHGFDDEGRHFDAAGNLKDWWAPADSLKFTREAQKVVDQYDRYIQVDTFHVNGKLTLGENIADFGGLLTAYDALQRALQRNGRPKAPIEGFTPEQRFFISFAQSWRSHSRPEALRTRVTVDPHAPDQWRSNGPLSNMPAFAAAFGCKPGDPMVRPPTLVPHIW